VLRRAAVSAVQAVAGFAALHEQGSCGAEGVL
jgi:hypothetical protein